MFLFVLVVSVFHINFFFFKSPMNKENPDTTGHQDGNKAKSSNVPLYLKKIKMSFNHPPRPNKVFAPPVSSLSVGDRRVL